MSCVIFVCFQSFTEGKWLSGGVTVMRHLASGFLSESNLFGFWISQLLVIWGCVHRSKQRLGLRSPFRKKRSILKKWLTTLVHTVFQFYRARYRLLVGNRWIGCAYCQVRVSANYLYDSGVVHFCSLEDVSFACRGCIYTYVGCEEQQMCDITVSRNQIHFSFVQLRVWDVRALA
jgi:hypothetical protein